MTTNKPPALRRFLARVIAAKSGEPYAGRQEVAAEVLHALQLAQRICPVCGNEAYALEPSLLLCGVCHAPMQTPEPESQRIASLLATQSLKKGRAKPKPAKLPADTVEVRLLLTFAQARTFAKFLERGATTATTWATDDPAERAEMEGAIWAIGRQFRAAGVKEGQGSA